MSFFKNINITIEDRPADSEVKVGDVGKTTYVRVIESNRKMTIHESPCITTDTINEINALCTKLNAFPQFEKEGIYIQKLRGVYEDIPLHYISVSPVSPSNYSAEYADMYIPYGQVIYKTTFDRREEKYERFYKVEKVVNHPDAGHLKRPSTIIRHACRDCAFYGRCKDAPSCFTRYIREISSKDRMTLKDAVYFKYDKKNDKLISSTTTPCESSKASYISRYEWSKSLFADQHNKH